MVRFLCWVVRRKERDIVQLYDCITPYVQLVTGGIKNGVTDNNMLNFGYWTQTCSVPLEAQEELCTLVGKFSQFQTAQRIIDVGSGFCGPAMLWSSIYDFLQIICVNINCNQLYSAVEKLASTAKTTMEENPDTKILAKNISLINATSRSLPFADGVVDRVVALESAQHFKPLLYFIKESKRILKLEGLVIIAVPTINCNNGSSNIIIRSINNLIREFTRLRILYFTWASEHYTLQDITSLLTSEDFCIQEIQHIGQSIYRPLTDYYIQNRKMLKQLIKKNICSRSSSSRSFIQLIVFEVTEYIIYESALRMKYLSEKGLIDYVLIKAVKT